jgi:hypothetical protein
MTRVAAHINDAGITMLGNESVIYREPGFALVEDADLIIGNAAFAQARIHPRRIQHRFWSNLDTKPLADQRFRHLSAADLASRQLEQMWQAAGADKSGLVVAVPAYMQPQQLGLLLGIAAEIGIPIVAMVDAAVAATRREYRNAVPVHIDMSLHTTSISRMSQPGNAQIERTELLEDCGVYALFDTWLNTVAEAFVQQSRFDPLHTAETEQMLVDRLAGWLTEASHQEQVRLEFEFRGTRYDAELEAISLVGAVAPIYQQIASRLRAVYRADEVPAIQISDRVSRMPGLAEMLTARVGGEVFVLEPGATARGALARCRDSSATSGGVSLVRQLPWDQSATEIGHEVSERASFGVPTHLLFGNVAWQIGNSPLDLGSQDTGDARAITLAAEMPGLSRRHCSLTRVNGQCILEDHSRYGTFLNGHRIDGTSVLQTGDVLRVGSPGFEFHLITTDESHG